MSPHATTGWGREWNPGRKLQHRRNPWYIRQGGDGEFYHCAGLVLGVGSAFIVPRCIQPHTDDVYYLRCIQPHIDDVRIMSTVHSGSITSF
jgi:hypothetical protein